jgi:hypothetical protein
MAKDRDDEPIFGDREYALVADGIYKATCTNVSTSKPWRDSKKLFIWFELNGSMEGTRLFMSCRLPLNGPINRGHKYFGVWCEANGGMPERGDRMSRWIFKDKLFWIKTRTVKTNSQRNPIPENQRYSVVEAIELRKQSDKQPRNLQRDQ